MAKYVKGQSGNPGGRKRVPPELQAIFEAASPKAAAALEGILENPKAKDADKIKAAEVILDRAYGKPRQSVEAELGPETRESIEGMSLSQRAAVLAKAVDLYAAGKEDGA